MKSLIDEKGFLQLNVLCSHESFALTNSSPCLLSSDHAPLRKLIRDEHQVAEYMDV